MQEQSFSPLVRHCGIAAVIDGANVDTDQIAPRQFLGKSSKFELSGAFLYDRRFDADGQPRPDFILNKKPFDQATILVVGGNFGCGSSREHAAWAAVAAGIRVFLGPSFGEMFTVNCANNGILCGSVRDSAIPALAAAASRHEVFTIDLQALSIAAADQIWPLRVNPFQRHCLLSGRTSTDIAIAERSEICAFEDRRRSKLPWLFI